MRAQPWWQSFFDDDFASLVLDRVDPITLRRTIAFFEDVLRIRPGVRVLDQCCGTGRLAVPLAGLGVTVVAVDVVPSYVARVRARSPSIEAHCEDAASFVPSVPCAAAFNWWTSFGFDEDDRTSRAMLSRARDALVRGGRFALDYPNVPRVLAELETEMTTTVGDVTIIRRSAIDESRQTLEQSWSYVFGDGRTKTAQGRTRLHRPEDLARMFEDAGLSVVDLFGDVDLAPLGEQSPRCIVVGEAR